MILIDEADRTAVGYVCLWEGTNSGSSFLHLFNAYYQMVGRSSEVSLSKFSDTNMENVNDNNGYYDVAMQGIERTKTRTYQEVCIYPEKECFLYDWYWSMAYTCITEHSNDEIVDTRQSEERVHPPNTDPSVNAGFLNDMTNDCKYILLTFYVLLNKFIKMFIDFSKHNGYP